MDPRAVIVRLTGRGYSTQPPQREITGVTDIRSDSTQRWTPHGIRVIQTFYLAGADQTVELSDAGWYRVVGAFDEPWHEMSVE
jgi:hypothetical protein